MKKFSTLFSTALLSALVIVFLVSCQKEQSTATADSAAATGESARVVGISGSGPALSGSINGPYAAALAANYAKKYGGSSDNQAQSVAFSAKDLIAFINSLQTKYKSDLIYVNFGVYGKGAAPVDAKDYGKLTVFFTGGSSTSSNRRNNDGGDGIGDGGDALNHGSIYP